MKPKVNIKTKTQFTTKILKIRLFKFEFKLNQNLKLKSIMNLKSRLKSISN